jgi:hypothetical protein
MTLTSLASAAERQRAGSFNGCALAGAGNDARYADTAADVRLRQGRCDDLHAVRRHGRARSVPPGAELRADVVRTQAQQPRNPRLATIELAPVAGDAGGTTAPPLVTTLRPRASTASATTGGAGGG